MRETHTRAQPKTQTHALSSPSIPNLCSFGGFDRLVIELANYFELATAAVLPVEQVKQFFHDMIHC